MTIQIIVIAIIIMACILCNMVTNKVGVPMLLAFIFLGMVFGSDGIFKISFENFKFAETFCSIALIFIIFYGGFGTNWREAKKVAVQSIFLSSIGVIVTALVTTLFCHLALGFEWLESFLIGAVLSSTDAASVFAILRSKNLNLKYKTASMLELESGSNDPWAYMLTFIILSVMSGEQSLFSMGYTTFAQIFFGLLFGIIITALSVLALKYVKFETAGFDTVFVVAIALMSYAIPTALGGNGYLSTYFVGIVLGNKDIPNKKALVHFFDGITSLLQIAIFFLLGLLAFPSQIPAVIGPSIAIFLFLSFIARPIAVAGILMPFKAKLEQQAVVAWAGLRGATSIVFAIMVHVSDAYMRSDIFHIAFCVVLLSIGIQGTALPYISKKLHMIDAHGNVLKTFNDYSDETKLQFVCFDIPVKHSWNGQIIKEITLPPHTRIVLIIRDGKKVIPRGNTKLLPYDQLILSATSYQDEYQIVLSEVLIDKGHEWWNKKIFELKLSNASIVLIQRGNKTLTPNGEIRIRDKDTVVLLEGGKVEEI